MTKTKCIHFWISEKEKENWKDFVDDSEFFSSVSELIRTCVSGYITGDLIEKKLFRVFPKLSLKLFRFTLIEQFELLDENPLGFVWFELLKLNVRNKLGVSENMFKEYLKQVKEKYPVLINISREHEKTWVMISGN